jgi:hypothetical protein
MTDEIRPEDLTRRKQTYFLSAEFLITMLVQTGVFLVVGTTPLNRVEARVSALEAQQVTAERIARIEEKMGAMLANQADLKDEFKDLKTTVETSKK